MGSSASLGFGKHIVHHQKAHIVSEVFQKPIRSTVRYDLFVLERSLVIQINFSSQSTFHHSSVITSYGRCPLDRCTVEVSASNLVRWVQDHSFHEDLLADAVTLAILRTFHQCALRLFA